MKYRRVKVHHSVKRHYKHHKTSSNHICNLNVHTSSIDFIADTFYMCDLDQVKIHDLDLKKILKKDLNADFGNICIQKWGGEVDGNNKYFVSYRIFEISLKYINGKCCYFKNNEIAKIDKLSFFSMSKNFEIEDIFNISSKCSNIDFKNAVEDVQVNRCNENSFYCSITYCAKRKKYLPYVKTYECTILDNEITFDRLIYNSYDDKDALFYHRPNKNFGFVEDQPDLMLTHYFKDRLVFKNLKTLETINVQCNGMIDCFNTSNIVNANGKYMSIGHFKTLVSGKLTYLYKIFEFSSDFKLLRQSKTFKFSKYNVEFIKNFVFDNGTLIVPVTVDDTKTFIYEIPQNAYECLFEQ